MDSRFWRTMALSFVVGTAVEYCVALAISFYFNDRDEVFYALLILLALWALQLALWLKNLIVSTIYYYLMGKRAWVAEVESALRVNEFPIYDNFRPDAVDYLAAVARDERCTVDQVLYAAGSLGQIDLMRIQKPTMAWRMMAVCETAMDNYLRNPHPIPNRRKGKV